MTDQLDGRTPWTQRLTPLRELLRGEAGSAGVLLAAIAAALIWAAGRPRRAGRGRLGASR